MRNLRIHEVGDPDIPAFSKRDEATGDTILVVCTTNSHDWREGRPRSTCPRSASPGTPASGCATCSTGAEYQWGELNYVRLDPHSQPAHIFEIVAGTEPGSAREPDTCWKES